MPKEVIAGFDYGSSNTKVVLLSAEDLELDVKENGVLGNNGKDTMSSVVRIQKYGWLDAPMTRSRTSGPVAAEPLYKYRYPNARFGEARGFDHITIRYSKRDIGRLFVDINAKDMSQEYGGLELVRDKNGFMAFNLTDHLKDMNDCFAMTPLEIFREYMLKHIFREIATKKRGMYLISHLVLTVPVSAPEHIKEMYQTAAEDAIKEFPDLLAVDGDRHKLPEIHILAEPVAGMCYHLLSATAASRRSSAAAAAAAAQSVETPKVYLGVDVGDGTTDCCVNVFNPVTQTFKVVGSYGNSHLGAADVRHQLIDMMAEELMSYMPGDRIDQYVDVVWKAVIRATEDLSQDGDDKDEFDDFALDTNDPDCQTWLYEHVHITRHMVHQAAAVFIPAMTESLVNVLEVSGLCAADIDHVVLMGGGAQLPCVRQALRSVFGEDVNTTGQGGGSLEIAHGAARYVRHWLLNKQQQQQGQGQEDGVGIHASVSLPVGMHIFTKVTYRSRVLDPKQRDPKWPVSVTKLRELKRKLADNDLDKRAQDSQMLDQVIAHYEARAQRKPAKQLPRLPANIGSPDTDFELFWPTGISCHHTTPTDKHTIKYLSPTTTQLAYTINLYAADPLFKHFIYIGSRRFEVDDASQEIEAKIWVDGKQRVRCSAAPKNSNGPQLLVETTFDKEAVQRSNQSKMRSGLSPAAGEMLSRLSFMTRPAARPTTSRGGSAAANTPPPPPAAGPSSGPRVNRTTPAAAADMTPAAMPVEPVRATQQPPRQPQVRKSSKCDVRHHHQHHHHQNAAAERRVMTSSQSAAEALCGLSRSAPAAEANNGQHTQHRRAAHTAAAAPISAAKEPRKQRTLLAAAGTVERTAPQAAPGLVAQPANTARPQHKRSGAPGVNGGADAGVKRPVKRAATAAAAQPDSPSIVVSDSEDDSALPPAVSAATSGRAAQRPASRHRHAASSVSGNRPVQQQ